VTKHMNNIPVRVEHMFWKPKVSCHKDSKQLFYHLRRLKQISDEYGYIGLPAGRVGSRRNFRRGYGKVYGQAPLATGTGQVAEMVDPQTSIRQPGTMLE